MAFLVLDEDVFGLLERMAKDHSIDIDDFVVVFRRITFARLFRANSQFLCGNQSYDCNQQCIAGWEEKLAIGCSDNLNCPSIFEPCTDPPKK